jgi:hypothetical protein
MQPKDRRIAKLEADVKALETVQEAYQLELRNQKARAEAAEAALAEIAEEIDEGNICVCAEHKIDHIRAILTAALKGEGK